MTQVAVFVLQVPTAAEAEVAPAHQQNAAGRLLTRGNLL